MSSPYGIFNGRQILIPTNPNLEKAHLAGVNVPCLLRTITPESNQLERGLVRWPSRASKAQFQPELNLSRRGGRGENLSWARRNGSV